MNDDELDELLNNNQYYSDDNSDYYDESGEKYLEDILNGNNDNTIENKKRVSFSNDTIFDKQTRISKTFSDSKDDFGPLITTLHITADKKNRNLPKTLIKGGTIKSPLNKSKSLTRRRRTLKNRTVEVEVPMEDGINDLLEIVKNTLKMKLLEKEV